MSGNKKRLSKKTHERLQKLFLDKEGDIRKALMKQAKKKEPIGYKDFCASLYIPYKTPKLAAVLDKIALEEGRPYLNIIVINKNKKKPGDGFFKKFKTELIKSYGNLSDRELYKKELEKLFKKYS